MNNLTDHQLIVELKDRLEKSNRKIREFKLLNDEIKNVNKKLQESEALKSHFLSNITNEIINPFTSIMGLSEHLTKIKKGDWEKAFLFSEMIYKEAFEMNFQMKNIFSAAKIEAGEFAPQISNVKVVDLVNNCLNLYKKMADKKNIKLKFYNNLDISHDRDFVFKTDPDKFNIILSNLVNNSIRFSEDEKDVEITLELEDENILILKVKDNGIGINEEHKEKIFNRFFRLDNSINSINQGLGLGLTVTKEILEMFEGEIEIKDVDKGAEFIVRIPESSSEDAGKDVSTDSNEFLFDGETEIF